DELRLTNLVTTDLVADVLPQAGAAAVPVAEVTHKSVQDRFVSAPADAAIQPVKSTRTAEVLVPTGGVAAPAKRPVSSPPRAASLWPRSGRSHPPPHRRSAWSRHDGPCSRARVPAARCRPICGRLAADYRSPSASCERFRATPAIRSRLSRPHGAP